MFSNAVDSKRFLSISSAAVPVVAAIGVSATMAYAKLSDFPTVSGHGRASFRLVSDLRLEPWQEPVSRPATEDDRKTGKACLPLFDLSAFVDEYLCYF
jgi:hypothetical protein